MLEIDFQKLKSNYKERAGGIPEILRLLIEEKKPCQRPDIDDIDKFLEWYKLSPEYLDLSADVLSDRAKAEDSNHIPFGYFRHFKGRVFQQIANSYFEELISGFEGEYYLLRSEDCAFLYGYFFKVPPLDGGILEQWIDLRGKLCLPDSIVVKGSVTPKVVTMVEISSNRKERYYIRKAVSYTQQRRLFPELFGKAAIVFITPTDVSIPLSIFNNSEYVKQARIPVTREKLDKNARELIDVIYQKPIEAFV